MVKLHVVNSVSTHSELIQPIQIICSEPKTQSSGLGSEFVETGFLNGLQV